MNMMISSHSLSLGFSSAIFSSTPKKDVVHWHAKITGHGLCSTRKPPHCTPTPMFQPSATMVDGTSNDVRPLVTSFAPTIWGDIFSTYSFDDQEHQKYYEEIEALKEKARSMLIVATSTKLLILIDKLERLGLAFHFEKEIEDKLKQVYDSDEDKAGEEDDLFTNALRFRLLRQHQYHVSCNAFAKFVDKDNKLKESFTGDVEGLLSLYEAAHVRIHDEHILEEAVAFTTSHLTRMLPQLESKEEVQHALRFPLHKSPTIITLRSYIDIYENDRSRDESILRLAKLNFNFMQNVFRNELFQLTKWWNKLDLASKVPYFRDRLVECYMWVLGHHFEPRHAPLRIVMTKFYLMITAMDDTYDNYATLEEIELFTQALERWNVDEIDMLPEYLKLVYQFIMSFSEEFQCEAEKQGKSYMGLYHVEAMKQLGRGYAQEQKWIMEKQSPSFEEYMINSRFTTLHYVIAIVVVAMTESGTKETIDWMITDYKIPTTDIIRLTDDLFSYQRESKDGTVPTCMEYYMKDKGASLQEAKSACKELIEDRWKDLNAAWVDYKSMVPKDVFVQFLNIARMCSIIYLNDVDNFTYPENNYMKPIATALFLDSIPV